MARRAAASTVWRASSLMAAYLVRIEHAAVDQGPLHQDQRVMAASSASSSGDRYLLWVSWEECE